MFEFKTDALFWDTLLDSGIKERLAQHIVRTRGDLSEAMYDRAFQFQKISDKLGIEAWNHFHELNPDADKETKYVANPMSKKVAVL